MIADSVFIGLFLVVLQISMVIGSPRTPTFNHGWWSPFHEKSTTIGDFTLQNKTIQKVQMMRSSGWHSHNRLENLPAEVFVLSFDQSDSIMVVILPDGEVDLNIVEEKLKAITLSDIMRNSLIGRLSLPKFKLSTVLESQHHSGDQNSLNVGMFDYGTKRSVKHEISQQKAFLDVNERGVSTSLDLQRGGRQAREPSDAIGSQVDRPFIVIIYDDDNKNIILQARIADPTNTSYVLKTTGTAPKI